MKTTSAQFAYRSKFAAGVKPGRRVPSSGPEVERKNVTLDEETIRVMTALGDGNLSAGVRRARLLLEAYRPL